MSTFLHVATVVLLGADDELDPEIEQNLTPGWVGAIVIVGLMVVTVLLWLSMRRQFRKIRFEEEATPDEPSADARDEADGPDASDRRG
jgi:hypothetical protein